MLNSQLVKDSFGQYYKIQTSRDKPAPTPLTAEFFSSPIEASRFANNIIAPYGFWKSIYQSEALLCRPIISDAMLIEEIASLFFRGTIKAYKVQSPSTTDHPPELRSIRTDKEVYTFSSSCSLLTSTPKEVKSFDSKKSADTFLSSLNPDKDKLKTIAAELNIAPSNSSTDAAADLRSTISQGLVAGNIIVSVSRIMTPAKPAEQVLTAGPGEREAGLGPEPEPEYKYKVLVTVKSRAGDIPLQGVQVSVDGSSVGNSGDDGKAPVSSVSTKAETTIKATYKNDSEGLKEETFEIKLKDISAEGMSYTAEKATNKVVKVQDVFGSGTTALPGDKDFIDNYDYDADKITMKETDDPHTRQIEITILMATFSLNVPYLSQIGPGETITTQPATPTKAAVTHNFRGSIICMPTSVKMMVDYWDINDSENNDISRNDIMQGCWDASDDPSVSFPCPWQIWSELRDYMEDVLEDCSVEGMSVSSGPASSSSAETIPSAYANSILAELSKGKPVVKSTYATSGHVMCIRGAVVDHSKDVQWLIINDPYGNLAGEESIYGRIDLSAPVGLRGTHVGDMNNADDVQAVRDILKWLGHYDGDIVGPIDETDANDPTVVAIKAFQGGSSPDGRIDDGGNTERRLNKKLKDKDYYGYSNAENEKNTATGDDADRGKHVYYNGSTEAKGTGAGNRNYRLKEQAFSIMFSKSTDLTTDEIASNMVKGA